MWSEDIGYAVGTAELTLRVRGMSCAACILRVEGALTELEGVVEAAVSLGSSTARVRYMPGVVSAAEMKRAVSEVGYEAEEGGAASREREGGRWLSRYWLPAGLLLLGLYAGLPWLAPLLMKAGWEEAGRAIYLVYATQCHQLPQRSFFLFGPQPMISLAEVQEAWQETTNPFLLRQFVGSAEMGWKVAWSDRMAAMYGSLLLFGVLFLTVRRRLRPLPWWALGLLVLPLALDGVSHSISDMMGGIGGGFRDANGWLAMLTGNVLPAGFYAGDGLGSFNSWMRLISGVLFGLGVAWFVLPRMEGYFGKMERVRDRSRQDVE